jgi:hypothetical protein
LSNIFISYRREDAAPWAGRICDRLEAAFGADHVFMDVEDIAPGADFVEAIEARVASCDILLAIIGPKWLATLRARAQDSDYVEHEIQAALRRNIRVIPVLVGGVKLPDERELPPALSSLARRQAVELRDSAFDQDVTEFLAGLRSRDTPRRLIWIILIAGVALALAGAAIFLTLSRRQAALDGTWIVRLQAPGQRAYTIRLQFVVSGNMLGGQVEYPTGTAAIEAGSIEPGRVTFFTRHTPQFSDQPARINFIIQPRGRELDITTITDSGGIAKGIARKSQ